MNFKLSALVIIASLMLVACNPFESFEKMAGKQDEFNKLSLSKLGVEAQLGWNITNGKLTRVTITYPANSLHDVTLGELQKTTLEILHSVFGEQPNVVTIGVNVTSTKPNA